MGDEGQPSAVAERGSFVVIGYLLWQLSRISAVWPERSGQKPPFARAPGNALWWKRKPIARTF